MELELDVKEFVSGERLQALAEVSVIPIGNGNGESECGFVKEQQSNNNYNVFLYDDTTSSLPDFVQKARVIFVNTWTLDKFFRYIFPLIETQKVFVSHNSDVVFGPPYIHFLKNDKVVKWFSQNLGGTHPKLTALPIGLGNQQYPHGDVHLLKRVVDENIPKSLLVYKNFDTNTNQFYRTRINRQTALNGISMSLHTSQEEYFRSVAASKFVISPPGNGPDCHRVWESLYLGAIPVVERDVCYHQFEHLPILFVDHWTDVTPSWLEQKYTEMSSAVSCDVLMKMSFWADVINT